MFLAMSSVTFVPLFFPSEWLSNLSLLTNTKYLQTCFSQSFTSLRAHLQVVEASPRLCGDNFALSSLFLPAHLRSAGGASGGSAWQLVLLSIAPAEGVGAGAGSGCQLEAGHQSAPPFQHSSENTCKEVIKMHPR